jgi:hypothetical protein
MIIIACYELPRKRAAVRENYMVLRENLAYSELPFSGVAF